MTVPEFLPVLSSGAHSDPRQGACLMEYVSLLAGEPWTDQPACTHPLLSAAARWVNDELPAADRQALLPLVPRLVGTADTREDAHARWDLSVGLVAWGARYAMDAMPPVLRKSLQICVDNLYTGAEADLILANHRNGPTVVPARALSFPFSLVLAAIPDRGADFLAGLLDEFDRLTGRTTSTTPDVDLGQLRATYEAVAAAGGAQ